MENQDKLYEQFQQASKKAEAKDFAAMDKVWGRVEEKLDKKVLKNENKLWKKIAVAASFLLLMTLGYQFFKTDEILLTPENEVVNSEIKTPETPPLDREELENVNSFVSNEEAKKIIQEEAKIEESVAIVEDSPSEEKTVLNPIVKHEADEILHKEENDKLAKKQKASIGYLKPRVGNAQGIQNNFYPELEADYDTISALQILKKQDPLFVIDGKAIRKNKKESEALLREKASEADIESIEILTEPLYIINGVEYTEESLFGAKPTSPYFPLNKQEIISTTILQGESALNQYGEKGRKGVVIITTKNGKPLKK